MTNNNSVTVLVFKFSMDAMIGLVIASFFSLIFFFYFIFINPAYIWVTLPLIIFLVYIKLADKAPFKTRIIDENKLIFSTDGIQYGEDHYSVKDIEAIAIYLYAFEDFQYGNGSVSGAYNRKFEVRAPGDRNKISFRSHGEVLDFDFYLDNFAQFSAVRKVIKDWASEGINVVLKQEFDDEFIVQEMNYYNTPTGF